MYAGTQNTTPGIVSNQNNEDYGTGSFYRVKVTGGENQINVKSGPSSIGPGDRIMSG